LLDRLKQEHELTAVRISELRHALTRYQQGGSAAFPRFAASLASYAAFHWGHVRLKENHLVPLANMHLTGEDWEASPAQFHQLFQPPTDKVGGTGVHRLREPP
jgi:hemerythrin-like domain-containing protein